MSLKLNTDSPKYIVRSNNGMSKHGTLKDDTQSSHRFSFRLLNNIETRSAGGALSDARKEELVRAMNRDGNLRIKARSGNTNSRTHPQLDNDDNNDEDIVECIYGSRTPIKVDRVVRRVIQAYKGALVIADEFPKYARVIGDWECEVHGQIVPVKNAEEARKRCNIPEDTEEEMVETNQPAPIAYDSSAPSMSVAERPSVPSEDVRVQGEASENTTSPTVPTWNYTSRSSEPSDTKSACILIGICLCPFMPLIGIIILAVACFLCD